MNRYRNLVLDIQGQNPAVKPGAERTVKRELILRNRSSKTINVNLWIEPNDDKAVRLAEWCQFSESRPRIEPDQTKHVQLSFEIPILAEPGFYSYNVCAVAQEFPEATERRSQQIELLVSEQDIELRNEPTFYLDPPTSSEHPYELQPGATFPIQITVENRSRLVDRLSLSCPELPSDWFHIDYSGAGTTIFGRTSAQTKELQLNPDSIGHLTLYLHPPLFTPAGHYSTTLRLKSVNRDDLFLLDILYFTLQVNDRLNVSLDPKTGKVPGDNDDFTVIVQNQGNIQRNLSLFADDSDHIFSYAVDPAHIQLNPGEQDEILIHPKARKWWKQHWRRQQEVPFKVHLINTIVLLDDEVDVSDSEAALNDPERALAESLQVPGAIDGKIVWKSRPTWLRWLLILALLLGLMTLVYWLVRLFIINPTLQPQVIEFSTPSESYPLTNGNPIPLDWEISNLNKLQEIQIIFLSRDAGETIITEQYEVAESEELTQWLGVQEEQCRIEQRTVRPLLSVLYWLYGENTTTQVLICQALQIQSADGQINDQPLPQPSISGNNASDELNNRIPIGSYDVTIKLVPRTPGGEQSTSLDDRPQPLISSDVAIAASTNEMGDESHTAQLSDQETIRNIQGVPGDPPEITHFYSKAPIYRESTDTSENNVFSSSRSPTSQIPEQSANMDGESEITSSQVDEDADGSLDASVSVNELSSESVAVPLPPANTPLDISAQFPDSPILMTWMIERPWEIESLELSYVAIASDGDVEIDSISYQMDEASLPEGVEECRFDAVNPDLLICEDVPTNVSGAGEYTFTLTANMPPSQGYPDITLEAEQIEIFPAYPQILSFTADGEDVLTNPQIVKVVGASRGPNVLLEWAIENPEQMQIELLPSPGTVSPDTTRILYELSPEGNMEITLQVTNAAGEQVSRTVTLATVAQTGDPQPILPVPTLPSNGFPPPPPTFLEPEQLPPIQVPPSGN
jgi:hypothetical protein